MAQNQNNMTQQSTKHRALLLAAMMVISVFAMSIAFTGAVAADNRFETTGDNVTDGSIIFQGEAFTEAQFTNDSDGSGAVEVNVTSVESLTTDSGDVVLTLEGGNIPTDQQTGVYSSAAGGANGASDVSVIVREPRVTNFDIDNSNGEDVAGGTLLNDESAAVDVEANYLAAENLTVIVEDATGVDVTNEWFTNTSVDGSVSSQPFADVLITQGESVQWNLSAATLGALEPGTYTLTVEGDENLRCGDGVHHDHPHR
jgi:surface glycoprotein (TIGR04207 family)